MSEPAQTLYDHQNVTDLGGEYAQCRCGTAFYTQGEQAEHQLRELQQTHFVVQIPGRLEYRVASSLGPEYMVPQPFPTLDEAETFLANHNKALAGLPGVDTVRIESRPPAGKWVPAAEVSNE